MAILYKVFSSNPQAHILIFLKLFFTTYHSICLALVNSVSSISRKLIQSTTLKTNPEIDNSPSKLCSHRGFTLTELIVTVAVLAIIATIAVPAILTHLAHMEAKRIRYAVVNTLAVAKAESLIRRQDLLVCLSDGNGNCNKNSNKTLLVFIDKNDNKHFDTGTDTLLKEQTLSPKYGSLHLRAGKRRYVKFYGDSGKPRGHFGHIKYCTRSTYSKVMYQISFNRSGIVKYKPNDSHPTECDQ